MEGIIATFKYLKSVVLQMLGLAPITSRGGTVDLKYPWLAKIVYYIRLYWWGPAILLGLVVANWLYRMLLPVILAVVNLPWMQYLSEFFSHISRWYIYLLGALTCRTITILQALWKKFRTNHRR